MPEISREALFLAVGAILFAVGALRLLLSREAMTRVLALNVAGAGTLVVLVALAHGVDPRRPDPVLHALALTGIVITVSVTGLALVLLRLLPEDDDG